MKKYLFLFLSLVISKITFAQNNLPLLFGVAYYDEYMPYERLDKDIAMMKDAGINVVRIAESTWSTVEPQDNVWDFKSIDRVLNAMHKAGIKVIIGTPTYAIPTWLAKKYPSVLVTNPQGQRKYGARQNMDITDVHYRFHSERVIRKIMEHVKNHPAIIGYQVDNETKHYGTSSENVQKAFVAYIKDKFKTLDAVNKAFGLDYWSNRINNWNDFPAVNGTFSASINASLNSEFSKFQRKIVTDFLNWQTKIVKEYAKPNQFVTQNFDLEWRGYSYGIQPDVDHFAAAKALDVAGIDVYHPTQDNLTGIEISLGGDLTRSMKDGKNYFVIETEAQGFAQWVPYPNQLRLQAFSHVASGANMLEYWHWHSIHNSFETYWKGLLSHDFEPNPTYNEAKTIGKDFARLSDKLISLKKNNDVAILFSNEALTAFNAFGFGFGTKENYNDILRPYYDALYKMNVGTDFIDATKNPDLSKYKLIIVPALYAASDDILKKLNQFVKEGGHVLYTFKSGFSDENVKVRSIIQPGIINEACGISYSQFTIPQNVSLKNDPFGAGKDNKVSNWMEFITPSTANVLAYYEHPSWGNYAAVTQNQFGKGTATYVGCMTSSVITEKIVKNVVEKANLWKTEQQFAFPIIVKSGINQQGKTIRYIFNYSAVPQQVKYNFSSGKELLSNELVSKDANLNLEAWGVKIVEEN
ncbi:beta-galactosidase [Lacihabitans sp. CS3-21]|uniref:beta-galactosidase n=1 Tax=Lacihabitans sp. CS3-21 TaxID=2487332 RepID=UPI0020CEA5A2|nr:beta-galactosidase [Lacihabitans sp. CS3-21]MCP9746772.1 beta-galactosidase [Lacihabitans sp. CS3-21]